MLFQEDWLKGINRAQDAGVKVFVGRFETFAADWLRLCEFIGFEKPPVLVHLNHRAQDTTGHRQYETHAEQRRDYRPFWTPEMRKVGECNFKWMIKNYGYEFGRIYEEAA